ncbi:MAG TPA: phosphatase PAP2 family protein [Pirellulales bacterium]|nr:phosphatase PAP2 family protein [Pirellulales bacterium]
MRLVALAPTSPITRCEYLIVGVIIVLTFGLLLGLGLTVPTLDILGPIAFCGALGLGAAYYWWRGVECFMLCLRALAILVGTTAVFGPLTYAVATLRWPWFDNQLAAFDSAFGLSAGALVRWTSAHPAFDLLMRLAYSSVFPQIILVIVVLGFSADRRLDIFLIRFMLGGLLTSAIFAFLPAQGTCVYFGMPTPDHYVPVLSELDRLRRGVAWVSWRDAQGIVTFPSFHTIWAVLLIAAFRGRKLFYPILILNSLVLLSCVTTGMHYFVDVLGGLIVTAIAIVATRPLCAGLEPVRKKQPARATGERLICESPRPVNEICVAKC